MQKKVIAFITSLCIVITCSAPSYAIDISTSSAISLNPSRFSVQAIGGTSGTLANGDTVAPVSSAGTSYYYNGTSSTASNAFTINSWGMLVNAITRSISETGKSLGTILGTTGTNTVNAINDIWTRLGITNGLIDDVENQLNLIRTYTVSVANNTADSASDVSSILSAINNGLNVDIGSSFAYPWGYYTYFINNPNVTLDRINQNGNYYSQQVYTKNLDYFGFLQYWILNHVKNVAFSLPLVVGSVKNNANTDVLTNSDLTTTALEHDSLWDDIDHIGSNLSGHLARLAYVLASDEEIEARQAASDNQSAAVDNFIKSNGSGSASAADIGEMANVSSSMSNMLGSDISPSTAFSSMSSDSDAWSWFSQETADSLDQRTSTRRLLKGSNKSFISDYYKELESIIGVKLW